MATLAKIVHQLCSDEASAANNHDLHFVIHVRLFLEGFFGSTLSVCGFRLTFEEREQVGVDDVGLRRDHAVR